MTKELTDLDQIDLIQDTLCRTYATYCSSCAKSRSSGGKSVDFAIRLFEEGWTCKDHFKMKCPECSAKTEPN